MLRFPPAPAIPGASDGRVRLAVRLDDGVATWAGSFALRLPGQGAARGPRDYSPRPLTDALTTAIATTVPFVDGGLEGLPQVVEQRVALGLWRLTVAATLTAAEQHVIYGGRDAATVLSDEHVAWHGTWRLDVMRHLARLLLTGPDASANLQMLRDQTDAEFVRHRYDLERTDDFDHPWLRRAPLPASDASGRGGAAVWRAERKLGLSDIARWLTTPGPPSTLHVRPPGWDLCPPAGWEPHRGSHGMRPTEVEVHLVRTGRVLRITHGSRWALWPFADVDKPVPAFDAVIAGAMTLQPTDVVELALMPTKETRMPRVPAGLALDWGFISELEHDRLVADAAQRRRAALNRTRRGRSGSRLSSSNWRALETAVDDPGRFTRLARRLNIKGIFVPCVKWRVGSVAEALEAGATESQLRWLVGTMREVRTLELEVSMQQAWHEGFRAARAVPPI